MSDELRLPERLAACEARLAAHPLGASPLNRDEVLFRAGWVAAEAELARRAGPVTMAPAPSKKTAALSLASAALAASLAIAITWPIASSVRPPAVVENPDKPSTPIVAADNGSSRASRRVAVDPLLAKLDALVEGESQNGRGVPVATLLGLSRRSRIGRWDEPILLSSDAAPSAPTAGASSTARELLDEYLPRRPWSDSRLSPGWRPADGEPSTKFRLLRPFAEGGDAI